MEEQFITNTLNKHNINSSVFIYTILILSGILEYVAWFGHQYIFKKGEFKKKVAFGVGIGLIRYITLIITLIYATEVLNYSRNMLTIFTVILHFFIFFILNKALFSEKIKTNNIIAAILVIIALIVNEYDKIKKN
jgi:drug/metabolite transporter (DMT)-like permease